MRLGICVPHYGRPIEVPRALDVARRAEARGLDSAWVADPVIVPSQTNLISIALEVSSSTYPAILETIDLIPERLRPRVA